MKVTSFFKSLFANVHPALIIKSYIISAVWLNVTLRDERRGRMEQTISDQLHRPVLILDARFGRAILLENGDKHGDSKRGD